MKVSQFPFVLVGAIAAVLIFVVLSVSANLKVNDSVQSDIPILNLERQVGEKLGEKPKPQLIALLDSNEIDHEEGIPDKADFTSTEQPNVSNIAKQDPINVTKQSVGFSNLPIPVGGPGDQDLIESDHTYQMKRELYLRLTAPSMLAMDKQTESQSQQHNIETQDLDNQFSAFQESLNNMSVDMNYGSMKHDERNFNKRFAERTFNNRAKQVYATTPRNREFIITEGKMISAVIETAINSSLPGRLRAIVDRDVFGDEGRNVLVPRGSELLGEYNSKTVQGQVRIYVVWTRITRPDGADIYIDSSGTDNLGRAGIDGDVDSHFWKRFGNSILLSLIGGSTANMGVDSSTNPNSANTYREAIAGAFSNTAKQELQHNANIAPTITRDQGSLIKVFVAHDLDFTQAQFAKAR